MIKAVLFDWFNTLVHYDPPREELYRNIFKEYGITVTFNQIYKGLLIGDRYFFSAQTRSRVRGASFEDRAAEFTLYCRAIAAEAGLELSPEIQLEIIRKVLKQFTGEYTLYNDVMPLFQWLKQRQRTIGVITNADSNVAGLVEKLGMKPFLDVLVTSGEVGVEKPDPPIFLAAIERSGVKKGEAVYIGDQYQSDVLGAGNVGMKAILLDRYDIHTGPLDYPRIRNLQEIKEYV
ncbi:MAG: HAD family hydrolase [Dehalococcoidales bacterium]|nr:HAD family hydrolase [Dehalococcoidales bacterium]